MRGHVERDERTIAVENAGYRIAYLLLSFGVLGIVALRSWGRDEQSWDLLGLVLAGGIVNSLFQARHRVLGKRWVVVAALTLIVALLVAVGMAAARG